MINSYNIISAFDKPHEKITIHAAITEKAEAEFIVKTIEGLIGGHNFFSIDTDRAFNEENNFSFSDFAILYRSSSQLKPIVEALKRSGMPFVNLSNGLLCDNKDVKKFLRKLNKTKSIVEQIENKFQGEEYIKQYLIGLAQKYTTKDDFINQLSLLNESDILDKNADRISLMTLHASKGLEFKCVFIAGLEDGLLPFYRAEDIEEEKRLFYAGMTRAEQLLYLTRAVKRKQQGIYKTLPLSPFLKKIEEDLINLSQFDKKFSKKEEDKQMSFDF